MSDPAAKMIAGDRTKVRVPIPAGVEAWVEIRIGDRRCRRPLLDICEIGISFEGSEGLPQLAPGSTFVNTVVRVEDYEIQGTMVVCHVTPSMATGTVYGARFHPPLGADRATLSELVERFWTGSPKSDAEPAVREEPALRSPSEGAETGEGSLDPDSLQCRHCLGSLTQDELGEGSTCPYCLQKLGR